MPLNKDFTFDGVNKIMQGIYETDGSNPDFPPGFHELDIQRDVYSEWKVWVREGDNAKYLQALSTTGGDPISSTISVGAYFFLENGWKIRPVEDDHRVVFNGNLYTRDDSTAYLGVDDYSIVTETRNSSLTQTVSTGGAGGGATPADIWGYSTRTLSTGGVTAIQSGLATTADITGLNDISPAEVNAEVDQALLDYDPPTKAELDTAQASIEAEIALQSAPTVQQIVDGVLDEPKADHLTAGSVGEHIAKKISTKAVPEF